MPRLKLKTDKKVIAKIFHPKVVEEVKRVLKELNAKRPRSSSNRKRPNMSQS
jgi:hypothetical protein